jgi:putative redox protein
MRQGVTAYHVRVEATRAETHPKVFTDVAVEHVIEGSNLAMPSVLQALTLAMTKYCPVVIMMGQATRLTHRYRVIDAATGEEHAGALE